MYCMVHFRSSAHNPRLSPLLPEGVSAQRSNSAEKLDVSKASKLPPPLPRPASESCGHNAGQELCYLCHQRDRRNIPISFNEERKKREEEEDRMLQQYQHLKNMETIINEQVLILNSAYSRGQKYKYISH